MLRGQPELIVLPLLSGLAIVGLFGAFIAVEVTTPSLLKMDKQIESPWFYAALFVTYLACAFVAVFCNAALVYCAHRSFEGRRATVGLVLKLAASVLRSEDGLQGTATEGDGTETSVIAAQAAALIP